jgi:hypothetical protein
MAILSSSADFMQRSRLLRLNAWAKRSKAPRRASALNCLAAKGNLTSQILRTSRQASSGGRRRGPLPAKSLTLENLTSTPGRGRRRPTHARSRIDASPTGEATARSNPSRGSVAGCSAKPMLIVSIVSLVPERPTARNGPQHREAAF